MKEKRVIRCQKVSQKSEVGGSVDLTDVREKYARIYKEKVAPRKTPTVPTPETIRANRKLFKDFSTLRKEATTKGLGGRLPDER